ncbi:MAG: hypothetical protein P857_182 [Candidatus Xenolissoclinum pacificiensis L6]|uniref:Uncharacterized protein n=1 Tax=Candidatus Xenolissoclinum pacificiensis L6 TaxID=1401685 RepID=W2UZW3_9RICK|nr:MAG: hypothetical protein P857_182 [Candidatus Xenolissoclinum pacificiensis L6]
MEYIIRNVRESYSENLPVSLELIKNFLNIHNNEQDLLIRELAVMAVQYAEWYVGQAIAIQKWKLICIGNIPSTFELPFSPIIEIHQVSFNNTNKVQDLQNTQDYRFIINTEMLEINRYLGKGELVVIYSSGYTDNNLPQQFKEGILHHVAYAYNNNTDNPRFLNFLKKIYSPLKKLKIMI